VNPVRCVPVRAGDVKLVGFSISGIDPSDSHFNLRVVQIERRSQKIRNERVPFRSHLSGVVGSGIDKSSEDWLIDTQILGPC
jgi:hypothetical protein